MKANHRSEGGSRSPKFELAVRCASQQEVSASMTMLTACRKRHMRCDERKPACKNCEDFKVECPGYPDKSPISRQPAILIAKPPSLPSSLSRSESAEETLLPDYYQLAFDDSQAVNDEDVLHTIRRLAQALSSNEIIRHGMSCIGALRAYMTSTRRINVTPEPPTLYRRHDHPESHRLWALTEYTSFLRCVQSTADMQTILVGCWLVFYFESLMENVEEANSNLRTGQRLCGEWLARRAAVADDTAVLYAAELEVVAAYMGLHAQWPTVHVSPVRSTSAERIPSGSSSKVITSLDVTTMANTQPG